MNTRTPATSENEKAIQTYKDILASVIERRPSGTRQRLADALGNHRSFITQITSSAYSTPIPAKHLSTVFRVCHFGPEEQKSFLEAYKRAHPGKLPDQDGDDRRRQLSISVPDLGSDRDNSVFDEAISEFAEKMAEIMQKRG